MTVLYSIALILLDGLKFTAAIWVPLTYIAFVAGRRRFSLTSLLAFITIECVAIAYCAWWFRNTYNFQ